MAENMKNTTTEQEGHGAVSSYIIGFVLSLIFTIIPYYLVTREVTTGKTLLLTILGFAVLQMFVQVFFFLHLGRGPKPLYNIVFFTATASLIVMVIGASLLIMDNLYRNMSPEEVTLRLAQDENIAEVGNQQTGACQGNNANHTATINGSQITPVHIDAARCDTLTLKIEDGLDREIVFAFQGQRASYGGLYELDVRSSRSKIITLNEIGDFSFYDSADPTTKSHFSVTP